MNEPKRHHWWPELQSKQWAGADGMIHVVRADGSVFRVPPSKIGVEGELYTRIDPTGKKDRDIERWFSREIETPFVLALTHLLDLRGIEKRRFPGRGDSLKRREVEELGFIVGPYNESMRLDFELRSSLANYLAALVVRTPSYLSKLTDWHQSNLAIDAPLPTTSNTIRGFALENMLYLYDAYREAIRGAYFSLMIADCQREFFFSDGGVIAKEPWSDRPLPFDLYVPLTPKIALNVLPLPNADTSAIDVARLNSRGVARYNRITLGNAKRFVFSRSAPPLGFVKKHFGVPAPAPIGTRWINGELETKYDPERDVPL